MSMAILIVCTAASSSASHDERHTSLDFRAKLATTAPHTITTPDSMDFLVPLSPAQSESLKAVRSG